MNRQLCQIIDPDHSALRRMHYPQPTPSCPIPPPGAVDLPPVSNMPQNEVFQYSQQNEQGPPHWNQTTFTCHSVVTTKISLHIYYANPQSHMGTRFDGCIPCQQPILTFRTKQCHPLCKTRTSCTAAVWWPATVFAWSHGILASLDFKLQLSSVTLGSPLKIMNDLWTVLIIEFIHSQ